MRGGPSASQSGPWAPRAIIIIAPTTKCDPQLPPNVAPADVAAFGSDNILAFAGWGTTRAAAGTDAPALMVGKAKLIPTVPTCNALLSNQIGVPTALDITEICAGGVAVPDGSGSGFQDPCWDDDGAPLMLNLCSPTNVLAGNADGDRLVGVSTWCALLPRALGRSTCAEVGLFVGRLPCLNCLGTALLAPVVVCVCCTPGALFNSRRRPP
jgi:hypothetical protein